MKIKLDEGATMPRREHSTDSGLDLFSREEVNIIPYGTATFHTGVHIELPPNTAGVIMPKSGLCVNHDITTFGLIDEGYSGEIIVKLFNHGEGSFHVCPRMKIAQLVIMPVLYETLELVDELDENTERGNNGIGSTGYF